MTSLHGKRSRAAYALLATLVLVAPGVLRAAPAKLLVTNATLVTLEKADAVPFVGYMAVGNDGHILAIGPGVPPADLTAIETLDASGKIVMPGFLSGHSHLWQ